MITDEDSALRPKHVTNIRREEFGSTAEESLGAAQVPDLEVSCLMAAYAGDNVGYLTSALNSIKAQVSVRLELVLVLDGAVPDAIRAAVDTYFASTQHPGTLVQMEENRGLAHALNVGLAHCRSDLVARFDADDISVPWRLSTQIDFLKRHPKVDVLGSSLILIDEDGTRIKTKRYPANHASIRRLFFLRNPIAHPAVVFRKKRIMMLGGYPAFQRSQDYALWALCLVNGLQFKNLLDNLVLMRTGAGLAKRRGRCYFRTEAEVLKFLRDIGSISVFQFFIAYAIRFLSRQFNQMRANFSKNSPSE